MKLTETDKELLVSAGYKEQDFPQIQEAITETDFTNAQEKKLPLAKVITILGRKEFILALARSAFHCSAYRETPKGSIYFNSKKLFKK